MKKQVERILIIGGVAGGASAAARARRMSESTSITILEKGPYVSFANCGLPYALGEIIEDREELLLQTPESLKERFNLDVRVSTQALTIDREKRAVVARNEVTGSTETFNYDKLVLSTGAEAIRPPLPGIQSQGVFTLQTIPDMDAIKNWIQLHDSRTATIIGGGFIGIETAENLVKLGLKVTLIERGDQVFPPADKDIADLIHTEMRKHGVNLLLDSELRLIEELPKHQLEIEITSKNGPNGPQYFDTDLVIMAIGVRPRSKIAKEAGLALGKYGGIQVDEFMRTSDPNIYAVGDVTEATQPQFEQATYIPLAGPANRQGRIAADHIFGKENSYRGTWGTSVCQVFDLTIATTGLSAKGLKKLEKSHEWITIHPNHHAGYYPGATPMTLKLIFDPTSGNILGSQIVGQSGVDKRIDVLSVALQNQMTVFDLEHLELAYAPPYGSAKDPINMAGFVASNVIRKDSKITHVQELKSILEKDIQLLDVRSSDEHEEGHIPGSINIPIDSLRLNTATLDPNRPIIVYCRVGFRGYLAYRILAQLGFSVSNLDGGFRSWESAQFSEDRMEMNQKENSMCYPIQCKTCGKTTWQGCGAHVDEVMKNIKKEDQCKCPRQGSKPNNDIKKK